MLRIHRYKHDIAVAILELVQAVLERQNLGRTHKREGSGYEKKDEPSRIIGRYVGRNVDFCSVFVKISCQHVDKRKILAFDYPLDNSLAVEVWCAVTNAHTTELAHA